MAVLWSGQADGSRLCEIALQDAEIDVRQALQRVHGHAFVGPVHGAAEKPELGDRAVILDEARVRRAAGGC